MKLNAKERLADSQLEATPVKPTAAQLELKRKTLAHARAMIKARPELVERLRNV